MSSIKQWQINGSSQIQRVQTFLQIVNQRKTVNLLKIKIRKSMRKIMSTDLKKRKEI